MSRSEVARAKVNLTLHVLGRRADGLHELESLVTFADLADTLTLDQDAAPGLEVSGPTAQVAGPSSGNLVMRAATALAEQVPGLKCGGFRLAKHLPVAAGLGGGSADAAAALRLLASANGIELNDPRLLAAATMVGADVPVCLYSESRMMRGTGERLAPPLTLPLIHAVLINPGVPLPTADVFRALGLAPGETRGPSAHVDIASGLSQAGLLDALALGRNDLETAAIACAPEIAEVLDMLNHQHRCALARMSGSGATCFGLFPTMSSAFQAVRTLRRIKSAWWIQPAVLGGDASVQ